MKERRSMIVAGRMRSTRRQRGQSAAEYLVVAMLLAGVAGAGWFGEGGGLLAWLLDALRGFHQRFAGSLALPL
ncbi:hypothetical protein EGT29_07835 [Pigmentiphaga sp. H8]|uniref:hypothetical protein n=1 Tax=Pigmentiphaga sp. H8 TaxID=2488560 RepID=UPI000F5AF186|nr:hypothetical protein [Pigmentiphaga sp. H8]AZG07791.1 hypothetical protein EGT29_07835 [Pigmentiphaga sp. H8]